MNKYNNNNKKKRKSWRRFKASVCDGVQPVASSRLHDLSLRILCLVCLCTLDVMNRINGDKRFTLSGSLSEVFMLGLEEVVVWGMEKKKELEREVHTNTTLASRYIKWPWLQAVARGVSLAGRWSYKHFFWSTLRLSHESSDGCAQSSWVLIYRSKFLQPRSKLLCTTFL